MKNLKHFISIKSLYVFILLGLICLIYSMLFYKKEGFSNSSSTNQNQNQNQNQTIVLMGDSILKNNVYVGKDKAVEHILKKQYSGTLINLARDNSTVSDIYDQIDEIDPSLNHKNTTIFVSIGGNDILNKYVYVTKDIDIDDFNMLYKIYSDYKDALRKLKAKMPKAKLMLMNLYYPRSQKYTRYRELIKKWNDLLFEYADDPIHKVNDVLDLSLIMTEINDFSLCIEPSEKGSVKIAREILLLSNE